MTDASTAHPETAGRWPDALTDLRSQPFPWWSFLITGAFGVALGLAVLIWPDISLRIMSALVGVWLCLSGLARIVGAFLPTGGSIAGHVLSGIVGVVVFIGGLLCLRNLITRLAVLALLFAITWLLSGTVELIAALQTHGARRVLLLIIGAISALAGAVFLFTPGLSLGTLVLMTGVSSLVVGLAEIVLAFYLRRPAPADEAVPAGSSRPAVA